MSNSLKIWGRSTSINVQKALLAIEECGLEYDQVVIGRQHGGNNEPWYHELNPNGVVPTIQDGDFVLWESNAIVGYLCGKYSAGNLSPSTPQDIALCHQWMLWQITAVYPHLHPIFLNKYRASEYMGGDALLNGAPGKMAKALDILNAQLEGKNYIMGNTFTMADIPVGAVLNRWYMIMPKDAKRHPNVLGWMERLQSRPSFKKHTQHELE